MCKPTPEEVASFEWGGQRARPRKKIAAVFKEGATYLKPPGSCNSNSKWEARSVAINIECVQDSMIAILDVTSQVNISECVNCRIIVGPCVGPVFIVESKNCTISVAAKELRLREVTDCTVRTYTPAKAVIVESCKDLSFGAWEVAYPGLSAQFASAGFDPKAKFWNKIFSAGQKGAPKNYVLLPLNYGLLQEKGLSRWSELKIAPEGLCGGTLTETKGGVGSVVGCECPCTSADGKVYEIPKPAPVKSDTSGAGGYGGKFGAPIAAPAPARAPAPASTIGSDGAGGYAAKFGGAAAGAPAETLPGFKPKPAPPKPQKNLLELLLDWVGTIFPYQITCVKKR